MPSSLFSQFLDFNRRLKLFSQGDRVLAAVSGGADSMVMLHLLKEAGVLGGVAHINYRLRGDDSELDEQLVEQTAAEMKVPFFIRRQERGWEEACQDSLQMEARKIRYNWFAELLDEHLFNFVATAHHLDDQAENILLQVSKGMNFTGFMGIAEKHGRVIRPMLFALRQEILNHAIKNGVHWREDQSNQTDDYQRNFIRNNIVPLLKQINPSFSESVEYGKWKASGIFELFQNQVLQLREKLLVPESDGSVRISLDALRKYRFQGSVLYHLIEQYGFHPRVCASIEEGSPLQSGTEFVSPSHRLIVDRGQIFLTPRVTASSNGFPVTITTPGSYAAGNQNIHLMEAAPVIPSGKLNAIAVFDGDMLQFPLEWRRWQPGDSFIPLGMSGHKKVSDFLIDEKVPVPQKEQVTVLVCGDKIAWVVGMRISQEFCLKDASMRAWRLEYVGNLS